MAIINVMAAPWDVTPCVLLALMFLCTQPLFYASPALSSWRVSQRSLLLLQACGAAVASFLAYDFVYRWFASESLADHWYHSLVASIGSISAVEEWSVQERHRWVSGFGSATKMAASPRSLREQMLTVLLDCGVRTPLPLSYCYVVACAASFVLGPLLLHQATNAGVKGHTAFLYAASMAAATLSYVSIEVLTDGRGYTGPEEVAIVLSVFGGMWFSFIVLLYFAFVRPHQPRSRCWALFATVPCVSFYAIRPVLTPLLYATLDISLRDALLTAGILAASMPFILAYGHLKGLKA